MDETKLAAARLKAAERYPFLGVALYALAPCWAPGMGTFGVDERWRLFIDPDVLDKWSVDEVSGVLLHEISHVVRAHADRARAAFVDASASRLWNIAADAEINDDLIADGIPLPGLVVTPRRLHLPAGKAAEFYFHRLLANEPRPLPECDCGPGAHGVDRQLHGEGVAASPSLPAGLAADEVELLRRQIAVEVLAGRAAGTSAAGWSRWAERVMEPVVDWRRQLAACLRGALSGVTTGRSDYRYHRPSRRRVPGVVLPALVRPTPVIAIVIDTSASVSDEMLTRAWSETMGMLSSVGVRREHVQVWSTDTVAHRVRIGRDERVELKGGGGTDMAEGIRVALAERPRPDLVIVLTDGGTPWPVVAPARPVIVGLLRDEQPLLVATPSWATTVEIPVDEVLSHGRFTSY